MELISMFIHLFEWIPWLIMKIISYLYWIKTTHCRLDDKSERPIANYKVTLPVGTAAATLRGTRFLKPFMGTFVVFTRQGDKYLPQKEMNFNDNKTWDARITLGNGTAGTYYAIVAEINPELKLLVDYYYRVGDVLENEPTNKKWIAIQIEKNLRGLKGLRKLQREIENISV